MLQPTLCEQGVNSGRGPMLRPLTPDDGESVRLLCEDCFPIQYPDKWFDYILSNKVYSLAVLSPDGLLMGIIVGELQPLSSLEDEAGVILDSASPDAMVMYIVSLGVHSQFRHRGLGTLLVNSLLGHVARQPSCKAVYLHVLASNTPAIVFYQRLGFTERLRVPEYYSIHSMPADGLLYCCYVNGAQPYSGSFASFFRRYIFESLLCGMLRRGWTSFCLLLKSLWYRRKYTF